MDDNFDEITGEEMLYDVRKERIRRSLGKPMTKPTNQRNDNDNSEGSEIEEVLISPKSFTASKTPLQKNLLMDLKTFHEWSRKKHKDLSHNTALTDSKKVEIQVHEPDIQTKFNMELINAQDRDQIKQDDISHYTVLAGDEPAQVIEASIQTNFNVLADVQEMDEDISHNLAENNKIQELTPDISLQTSYLMEFKMLQERRKKAQGDTSSDIALKPDQDLSPNIDLEPNFMMEFKKIQEKRKAQAALQRNSNIELIIPKEKYQMKQENISNNTTSTDDKPVCALIPTTDLKQNFKVVLKTTREGDTKDQKYVYSNEEFTNHKLIPDPKVMLVADELSSSNIRKRHVANDSSNASCDVDISDSLVPHILDTNQYVTIYWGKIFVFLLLLIFVLVGIKIFI